MLQVGYTQHLLHWSSTRQKLVAQSSAEAELIALMTGYTATKNFQHLFHESSSYLTPILRCDNQAVLAMLDKPVAISPYQHKRRGIETSQGGKRGADYIRC